MVVATGSGDLKATLSTSARRMAGQVAFDADEAAAGIGAHGCCCSRSGAAGFEWGSDFKVQTLKHA
jgi:hypothetical protein